MLRLCRLHDGLKHFVSQPRTVDDGIDARAEGFDGVEPANLAPMRHTAQKRAIDAPAAASLTAQLACEDAVGAAAELRKIHLRVHCHAALALHLTHRAQDTVGAAVVRAVLVAQRDDLRAAYLSRVHIVEACQIDIAFARDRVGRLEHMRAGAIDNGGVTVQKDRSVERIGVTRAVDVHDALARALHRRAHAAHEGRLAAAGAAFQNHQIVEPTAQKLVIEREKALFAVCAEEKVHRFHKIPPKIGAFSIAYACVAVPASRPSQILFVRQQRSVIQE